MLESIYFNFLNPKFYPDLSIRCAWKQCYSTNTQRQNMIVKSSGNTRAVEYCKVFRLGWLLKTVYILLQRNIFKKRWCCAISYFTDKTIILTLIKIFIKKLLKEQWQDKFHTSLHWGLGIVSHAHSATKCIRKSRLPIYMPFAYNRATEKKNSRYKSQQTQYSNSYNSFKVIKNPLWTDKFYRMQEKQNRQVRKLWSMKWFSVSFARE